MSTTDEVREALGKMERELRDCHHVHWSPEMERVVQSAHDALRALSRGTPSEDAVKAVLLAHPYAGNGECGCFPRYRAKGMKLNADGFDMRPEADRVAEWVEHVLTLLSLATASVPSPLAGGEEWARDALALSVVEWDGGGEDGCPLCNGEWDGGDAAQPEPFIVHAKDCPVVTHRLVLITALAGRDPAADSDDGRLLARLVAAQKRYERAMYPNPTAGSGTPTPSSEERA